MSRNQINRVSYADGSLKSSRTMSEKEMYISFNWAQLALRLESVDEGHGTNDMVVFKGIADMMSPTSYLLYNSSHIY